MSRSLQFAAVLLMLFSAATLQAGEMIDRIVATLGKRAILQSELNDEVRFEMFAAGRPLASVTVEDVRSTLNRIIDRQLIRMDVGETDAFAPSADDVNRRISEIRAQLPEASTDSSWKSILKRYGLDETLVRERVGSELETMRMVNQKLRPSVRIDQAEIETAYSHEFLPSLRKVGAKEPPLSEVSARIRQILVERHIGELLDTWVQGLRSQFEVKINVQELQPREPVSPPSPPSKADTGGAR